ncbi:MAG: hypothetical protein JHD35_01130 [Sphingopyxis sp.]|nr:hypothetical protein [Sphingopyxis sp.]
MVDTKREPFPYTDDFRRAKRNSLIWSGITLAVALGTPQIEEGLATVGSIGVNLGYEQGVLVVVSGVIAIFMIIGFVQALQRMRLHASNLFYGDTDVEAVFAKLSKDAREAIYRIKDAKQTFASSAGRIKNETDEIARLAQQLENPNEFAPPRPPHRRGGNLPELDELQAIRAQYAALQKWADEIKPSIKTAVNNSAGARYEAVERLKNLGSFIFSEFSKSGESYEQLVSNEVSALEHKVSTLKQFHDGIYRADRWWFWTYDVATVILLWGVSMIPFVRALNLPS